MSEITLNLILGIFGSYTARAFQNEDSFKTAVFNHIRSLCRMNWIHRQFVRTMMQLASVRDR